MNICAVGCTPGEQLFPFPSKGTDNESLFRNTPGPFQRKSKSWNSNVIVVTPSDPEFVIYKNQTGIFSQDQFQNENDVTNTIQIPILQPKPIIPTIKSISCSMSAQTNTRLCGSVQISEFLDEYRLNCFYCCNTFPIEKYSKFINHLKNRHFEKEEAFKMKKYPLGDHDYTTIRSRSPERINAFPLQPKPTFIEAKDRPFNIGMAETLMKLLDETLLNPNFRNTEEDNILVIKSNNKNKLRATNVLEQVINKESNARPEVEKITLYNKEIIPTPSVNPNLKGNIKLESKTTPTLPIESISDTESEFETSTEFNSRNVTPQQSNIPECSTSSVSLKNIDSVKLSQPHIPLPPSKKILIKKDTTVEKRVVQQTLKSINDFETVYKTVKKRPARAMSSGIFYIKDIKNINATEKQTSKQTPLNRCLKRANTDVSKEITESVPEDTNIFKPSPTELVFHFTPRDIILDFLDTIKDYPILWEFHKEPDNENYAETINKLCEKINKKWSLNLSPLKMRRSINRIFTDYFYMLPRKNVVKFKEYLQKMSEFLPPSVDNIPRKRCQYCDICYAKYSEMKKHLIQEHQYSNWQYTCPHCTQRFMEIDEYELHKHLPHYSELFECQLCNKSFTTIYTLERHKRNVHNPKIKPLKIYKCNMCDKEFKISYDLERHKTHHRVQRFKCHLCPKVYNQKTTLTFHLKKHSQQLDFVCEVCGRAFLKKSHLNSHLEKHTGVKVTCNICHIKLRKCSLSRHLRLCHVACEGTIESTYRAQCYHYKKFLNQNFKPFRTKRPFKRTKEEGPRIYDCKKCKIPFDRLKFLKEHNNAVHFDVKVMPCKICKIEFRHTHNIKIHYRQKHNLTQFQVYKLHDQNVDLDTVLNLQTEDVPETVDAVKNLILKQEESSLYCTNDQQDDGTNQNNSLQDKIMKAVENIDKQEIKVDNDQSMNEFFTDLFK